MFHDHPSAGQRLRTALAALRLGHKIKVRTQKASTRLHRGTNPVRVPLEQSGALDPDRARSSAASACPHAGAVSLTFADAALASHALASIRRHLTARESRTHERPS
jgi:hypothetical protein